MPKEDKDHDNGGDYAKRPSNREQSAEPMSRRDFIAATTKIVRAAASLYVGVFRGPGRALAQFGDPNADVRTSVADLVELIGSGGATEYDIDFAIEQIFANSEYDSYYCDPYEDYCDPYAAGAGSWQLHGVAPGTIGAAALRAQSIRSVWIWLHNLGLGDVISALPVLRGIRRQFSDAGIDLSCQPACREILEPLHLADRFAPEFVRPSSGQYDLAVEIVSNSRRSRAAEAGATRVVSLMTANGGESPEPAWRRLRQQALHAGLEVGEEAPRVTVSASAGATADGWLRARRAASVTATPVWQPHRSAYNRPPCPLPATRKSSRLCLPVISPSDQRAGSSRISTHTLTGRFMRERWQPSTGY